MQAFFAILLFSIMMWFALYITHENQKINQQLDDLELQWYRKNRVRPPTKK